MTLIDLIVALAVTGLVMTSGYAAFSTMADRRAAAAEVMHDVARAAAVRATLRDWLAGAELTVDEDSVLFRGLDGTHDGLADDELTFRTNAPTPAASAASTVRLYVDRNDSTPERGLVASVEAHAGTSRRLLELEPTVASLDIRYLSGLHGMRDWGTSWVSATVLPLGVELRLGGTRAESVPPLLRLPLLVALEGAK